MMMYYFIVLLSGILGMYARYNLLHAFKENDSKSSLLEKTLYIVFYASSYFMYFKYDTPIINLCIQLLFLLLIGYIMGLSKKNIILSSVIAIVMIVAIDSVVFFMTGYVNESVLAKVGEHSIIGNISSDMITLLVSLTFKNYKNVNKSIDLPFIYWSTVSIFPIMSLVLMIMIFRLSTENSTIVIYGTSLILIMNLIILWLYDRLIVLFEKKIEEVFVRQMNMSYRKQLEMMRTSIIDLKSFKHDFISHIVSIESLIRNNRFEKAEEYLGEIKKIVKDEDTHSNTGNLIVDSIINYEINKSGLSKNNITLKTVNIPMEFKIKDYDLAVLLSNIFSNALRAINTIENGKIQAYLKYHEGIFFLSVTNDFYSDIKVENGKFCTSFPDVDNHGYGIENIKRVVKKYDGELNIEYKENKFHVETLMYEIG